MRVDRLAGDLFLFRGETYDSGSLAVFEGDRTLLVDGMASAEDARQLRDTLVRELGRRVVFLVSTHYFSDHLAAWNLFPEATLIAHENAVQTFWREEFRTPEEAAHFREPTLTFAGRLELVWGRYRLELFENPGHTADTINVDIPEADLLHVADTAVGRIGYLHYSAPEALDRSLSRALARGRRTVLRSHGPAEGAETLLLARSYLRRLGERIRQARKRGEPISGVRIEDCLIADTPATEFEDFFHRRNLASIETRGLFPEAA
jgi:cyclase